MPEVPVQVTRADDGKYVASMVDIDDGPIGRGLDPYAAYKDLVQPALETLRSLQESDSLPHPSPPDDRPVIAFDNSIGETENENGDAMLNKDGRVKQNSMICYSWTNDVMFYS